MSKALAASVIFCAAASATATAQQLAEMSQLQAILVVSRDAFAKKCPQHIAIVDKGRHAAELAYIKRVAPPAAGENSYAAMRKRSEAIFSRRGICDEELKKHKAQTYAPYTYSNITLKK